MLYEEGQINNHFHSKGIFMLNFCRAHLLKIGLILTLCSHANAEILYSDSFELGFGNWKNTNNDSDNWLRDHSGTPSSGTGPAGGANNTNYYLYFETSSGNAYDAGDDAFLLSPPLNTSNTQLTFDYHMFGANTGTLAVDILVNTVWIKNVWSLSGMQQTSNSEDYRTATVDLRGYFITEIRIRATAAGGYRGDIALDNIIIENFANEPAAPQFSSDPITKNEAHAGYAYSESLADNVQDPNDDTIIFNKISGPSWLHVEVDGSLQGTPVLSDQGLNVFEIQASDGELASTATIQINVTDGSQPVLLIDDNFETDMGTWTNSSTNDTDWLRDSGGTTSTSTGPSTGADGSLYYLYLETSSGFAYNAGDTATIESDLLPANKVLLSFAYHMYGIDTGTLHVDVREDGSWIESVWSISGQQHTSYNSPYTKVDLELANYHIDKIRFRAVAAGGYRGDIALDNIQIFSVNLSLIDSDEDGVVDTEDQCPQTPANTNVNDAGCALSQLDSDNDGYTDDIDLFPNNPNEWEDFDGDGIGNNTDLDNDNDLVNDVDDAFPFDPTETLDTDLDGIGNNADPDDDNDNISDSDELNIYGTDPLLKDTDGDKIDDGWEIAFLLDPLQHDADADVDGDGFTNYDEYLAGSNPNDATSLPVTSIDALSLSTNTSCAIVKGKLHCWGGYGYPTPDIIQSPSAVTHNTSNYYAINNGDVHCWGYEYSKVFTETQNQAISGARDIVISRRTDTLCILKTDGTVQCVGNSSELEQSPNNLLNTQKIDLDHLHACSHNGQAMECWGDNAYKQLDVPTDLLPPLDITVGSYHSCALQDDHVVRCWGDNSRGQLNIPQGLGTVVQIDATNNYTCALSDTGAVKCWGQNTYFDFTNIATPANVSKIYTGEQNLCLISPKGAKCFGNNSYGQSSIWYGLKDYDVGDQAVCGINDEEVMCFGNDTLNIPQNIDSPITLGMGRLHGCVWANNGMHCWGDNSSGQLNFPSGLTNVSEISAYTSHSCAIDGSEVKCWGQNYHGVTNAPTDLTQPFGLAGGRSHNCVIDGNYLRCWGDDYYGQAPEFRYVAQPEAVSAGGLYQYPNSSNSGHTCFIDDGKVSCFGSNEDNVTQVPPGLNDAIDIYAGISLSCAVKSNGELVCWGDGVYFDFMDQFRIGPITRIRGIHNKICVQADSILRCSVGGALLIDSQ